MSTSLRKISPEDLEAINDHIDKIEKELQNQRSNEEIQQITYLIREQIFKEIELQVAMGKNVNVPQVIRENKQDNLRLLSGEDKDEILYSFTINEAINQIWMYLITFFVSIGKAIKRGIRFLEGKFQERKNQKTNVQTEKSNIGKSEDNLDLDRNNIERPEMVTKQTTPSTSSERIISENRESEHIGEKRQQISQDKMQKGSTPRIERTERITKYLLWPLIIMIIVSALIENFPYFSLFFIGVFTLINLTTGDFTRNWLIANIVLLQILFFLSGLSNLIISDYGIREDFLGLGSIILFFLLFSIIYKLMSNNILFNSGYSLFRTIFGSIILTIPSYIFIALLYALNHDLWDEGSFILLIDIVFIISLNIIFYVYGLYSISNNQKSNYFFPTKTKRSVSTEFTNEAGPTSFTNTSLENSLVNVDVNIEKTKEYLNFGSHRIIRYSSFILFLLGLVTSLFFYTRDYWAIQYYNNIIGLPNEVSNIDYTRIGLVISIFFFSITILTLIVEFIEWLFKRSQKKVITHLTLRKGTIPGSVFMQPPNGMNISNYETIIGELILNNFINVTYKMEVNK